MLSPGHPPGLPTSTTPEEAAGRGGDEQTWSAQTRSPQTQVQIPAELCALQWDQPAQRLALWVSELEKRQPSILTGGKYLLILFCVCVCESVRQGKLAKVDLEEMGAGGGGQVFLKLG